MRTRCFWFCEKVELQKEIERLRGVVKNIMHPEPAARLDAIAKAAVAMGFRGADAMSPEAYILQRLEESEASCGHLCEQYNEVRAHSVQITIDMGGRIAKMHEALALAERFIAHIIPPSGFRKDILRVVREALAEEPKRESGVISSDNVSALVESTLKEDDGPGTPLGRLGAIADATVARGLCTGLEAKPAELFLIEAYDKLVNPLRRVGVGDQPMSEDFHWGGNDGKAPVHPK